MRTASLCIGLALLAGCAKPEPQTAAKDTTAAALGAGAAAAPISLAAVAGKWTVQITPEASDSVILSYELAVTPDGSGWTLTFPNRPPVTARVVATAGDSIVIEAGPYESALRKGVQVSTRSVLRLQGADLVGTAVAHYTTTDADSVKNLRMHGTRAP
jgi:hypothetical protein